MGVLVVTGTGTGVGKTVVTAALAAVSHGTRPAGHGGGQGGSSGRGTVAVVKPAQTGTHQGEAGDLDEVRRLTGLAATVELARYPDPLSPEAAARAAGMPALELGTAAARIGALAASFEHVIVEGAGGLLVRYGPAGWTLADLAAALSAPLVLVAGAALGTLNHTALTVEALRSRDLTLAGLVIGSWPARPGLTERSNLHDLESLVGGPLSGALPDGAGGLDRAAFRALAPQALAPWLGGRFDPAVFREKNPIAKEPV